MPDGEGYPWAQIEGVWGVSLGGLDRAKRAAVEEDTGRLRSPISVAASVSSDKL